MPVLSSVWFSVSVALLCFCRVQASLFFLVFCEPRSVHSILWGWWGSSHAHWRGETGMRQADWQDPPRDPALSTPQTSDLSGAQKQKPGKHAWKTGSVLVIVKPLSLFQVPVSFIESEILASSVTPPAYPASVPVEPRGLVCCCFTITDSQGACQMPLGFSSSVLQLSLLKLCSLSFVSRRTQGSAEMKMLRTSWKIKGHRRYLLL